MSLVFPTIPLLLLLGAFDPPPVPSSEFRTGTEGVHDGVWAVESCSGGTFVCAGYTGHRAWIAGLSPDLELLWELTPDVSEGFDEALAIAPLISGEGIVVVGNSNVRSPGTRHMMDEASGWILILTTRGEPVREIDLSTGGRIVVLDVIPLEDGGFACCGFRAAEGETPDGSWLATFDGSGEPLLSMASSSEVPSRYHSLLQLEDGGFIAGGSFDDLGILFDRISTEGEITVITVTQQGSRDSEVRDLALTPAGDSCLAAGGGLWNDPFLLYLDPLTAVITRDRGFDEWFTAYSLEYTGIGPVLIGHNMLCDGADSETYLTSATGVQGGGLPLRIYGYGAVRCRSFAPLPEFGYLVAGEVSEEWGEYQDIWIAITYPSDWYSEEGGSFLFADHQY